MFSEIGIGAIKRALGNSTTPIVTISVNEDLWTVSVKSTFKNDQWQFQLNEKFRQTTIDGKFENWICVKKVYLGREFWCVVTLTDDGKIIETQVNSSLLFSVNLRFRRISKATTTSRQVTLIWANK